MGKSKAWSEAHWEQFVLERCAELGWARREGKEVAPGSGERESWSDIVLRETLERAVTRLNPDVPANIRAEAIGRLLRASSQSAIDENFQVHQWLVSGMPMEYLDEDGLACNPAVRFISSRVGRNEYHAVNQVTIRSREHERRFDVVMYVNGLPLAILELKNAGSLHATAEGAYNQVQTYVKEFPEAFRYCVLVVASDGVSAKYGTPFTPWNHFAPWNVDDDGRLMKFGDEDLDGTAATELSMTLNGLFNLDRFDQLRCDFTAFDENDGGLVKRIAKPHQYFAVTKAVGETLRAVNGDRRIGVVWHTQGSGKSMEMELYAAKVMRHELMANPTVVVLTDRTELDTQLFDGFAVSSLMPEKPVQIATREELRRLLSERRSGGIYFTTLQKFGLSKAEKDAGLSHPVLSDRRNVIVMVDEAHRSHYDNLNGYARHLRDALPNASHIAFTGTPIAEGERDTRDVFGADIDVYDLNRAVKDGATVPVTFEPRLISLARIKELTDEELDEAADEVTEHLDEADKDRLIKAVTTLETVYGSDERLDTLVDDFLTHWSARSELMRPFIGGEGKCMIVCATRGIAARVYDKIIAKRPDWHHDADDKGRIKVIYTANPSDPEAIKKHMRRPAKMKALKQRFKDSNSDLQIVIVQNMLLTGFDAPAMHTLYVDRPLKGALLMQTLARVNRTYKEKPGGLLVGYAPLIDSLEKAVAEFTGTEATEGEKQREQHAKIARATEAAEIVRDHTAQLDALVTSLNVDWRALVRANPTQGWMNAVVKVTSRLRSPQTPGNTDPADSTTRPLLNQFRKLSRELARAWALASTLEEVQQQREVVRFFDEVSVFSAKLDAQEQQSSGVPVPDDIKLKLAAVVVEAAQSTGVVDIYRQAGLEPPTLQAISTRWLAEAEKEDRAQIALEALKSQILHEVRSATPSEQRRAIFHERVDELMNKYTNQQLTAAEILFELAKLAKEASEERERGQKFTPALNQDELAFYDVVALNDSAVDLMGDDVLAQIARDLVDAMRKNTSVDWTVRADVRAKLRTVIKRLLRKYGYPPDRAPQAVTDVMDQMERLAPKMAEAA